MMSSVSISMVLVFILPFSAAFHCYPPRRSTYAPSLGECHELILRMILASFRPELIEPKTYGRGLPISDSTENLPKIYWLPDRGPYSCALGLDVDPQYPDARETFPFRDLGLAARSIVVGCLERRRWLGNETLGRTGHVVASIVRANSPRLLRATEGGEEIFTLPAMGRLAVTTNDTGD